MPSVVITNSVIEADVENDVYVAYNMWGDELVVSYEELTLYDVNDEFNFISTNLDGKSIVYIVK